MTITATDLFCGAGGSSSGLVAAGIEVKMAVNHWQLAIETHATNHPTTQHDCVDVRVVHPSEYPRTTIGWFSPECTNHSLSKGKRRRNLDQLDLWGNSQVDPAEERSRATMREVVEFSECHRYEIVIVENVVDIRLWQHYDSWLKAMLDLGYAYKEVYLNAQFFGVPQSRDRIYVVFWKRGNRAPNLDFRPPADCPRCGRVEAVQTWKRDANRWGRYGARRQYVYCCPKCSKDVEPYHTPAYVAIDWSLPTPTVGSRVRPLKPKTLERIRAGIQKFARVVDATAVTPPFVSSQHLNSDGSSTRVRGVDQPLPCVTTFNNEHAVVVPPMVMSLNHSNDRANNVEEPFPTIMTQVRPTLVVPPFVTQLRYGGSPASAGEPLPTQTGRAEAALVTPPLLMFMQGDHRVFVPDKPLSTIVASGSQHVLLSPPIVAAYYSRDWSYASADQPLPTVMTKAHHALIIPDEVVEACGFRMLEPHELKRGMSFKDDYIILGNKRDQTRQVGNAVCPSVAQLLAERCIESLS